MEEFIPYKPTIQSYSTINKKYDNRDINSSRPIVIGSGPAGLFAAYTLACSGFRPIIIEMGPKVERRSKDIMSFWKNNILTSNSNGKYIILICTILFYFSNII